MYSLLKPFLFLLPAETAHSLTLGTFRLLVKLPGVPALLRARYVTTDPTLGREVMGIWFPNPIGLAAGMDKNATLSEEWRHLGFGFAEIGTVTPQPQAGNPKPRLFRLLRDKALLNRMGFNNDGMKKVGHRLAGRYSKLVIGANIGKNKTTENDRASLDYELCFRELAPLADYVVVNVSSPNTPGLRALQNRADLEKILNRLNDLNYRILQLNRPILLKIAPDLELEALNEVIEVVKQCHLAGVVATNTTIVKDGLRTRKVGEGGISGAPLSQRSNEMISHLRRALGPNYTIIGVGGIMTPQDAVDKLKAGADLVQVYTGLIYKGPSLVRRALNAVKKTGL